VTRLTRALSPVVRSEPDRVAPDSRQRERESDCELTPVFDAPARQGRAVSTVVGSVLVRPEKREFRF
jgi:hypothetical protein